MSTPASADLFNTYRTLAGKPTFDRELRTAQLDLIAAHAAAVVDAADHIDAYDLRAEGGADAYETGPEERISLVFTAATGGRPRDLATVELLGLGTTEDRLVAREGRPSRFGAILASAPLDDTEAVIALFASVMEHTKSGLTGTPLDRAIEAGKPRPGSLIIIAADTPLESHEMKVLALRHGLTLVVATSPHQERTFEADADLIVRVADGEVRLVKNRAGRIGPVV